MKKKIKLVVYLLVMCLMVSIMPDKIAAAKSIRLSSKSVTLYVGETKTLKLKGTTKKPKWSSSKKSVATVSKKGKIKAKKQGTAVIAAKLGKKKYKCNVKVKAKVSPNPYTPPYDKTTVKPTSKPVSTPILTPISTPKSTPAIVPTSAPTIEGNYQKLTDYIVKNGIYDSDTGYYYIGDISEVTSATLFTSITYNLDGVYKFSVSFTTSDGAKDYVIVTITPPEYAKGAVANIFVQSSESSDLYYADGEVILSSLTATNHNITYTSTNAPTASVRDSLYKLGEGVLGLGLVSWNDMIKSIGLGLSLKDLGFTSYEEGDVATPTIEPTSAPIIEPTSAPTIKPTSAPTIEPTSAPTIEPTSMPTPQPTVANNYQKLMDYMVKNGRYNSDKKYYYIGDITTVNSAEFYTSITYNLDGSYEFDVMAMSDNGDHLVTLTITPPEYTKGAVVNIYVESSDSSNYIYANGEVILSTLTKTNQSITYTSTNATTESIKNSLYSLGEKALAYGLESWNDMIVKADLGLSLKDLGFTSY